MSFSEEFLYDIDVSEFLSPPQEEKPKQTVVIIDSSDEIANNAEAEPVAKKQRAEETHVSVSDLKEQTIKAIEENASDDVVGSLLNQYARVSYEGSEGIVAEVKKILCSLSPERLFAIFSCLLHKENENFVPLFVYVCSCSKPLVEELFRHCAEKREGESVLFVSSVLSGQDCSEALDSLASSSFETLCKALESFSACSEPNYNLIQKLFAKITTTIKQQPRQFSSSERVECDNCLKASFAFLKPKWTRGKERILLNKMERYFQND